MRKRRVPASDALSPSDNEVVYWEQQSSRLERDARRLRMVPILCWLTAIGVAVAQAPSTIVIALVALGLTIAATVAYMIMVRRQECAQGLEEAQRKQSDAGL